MTNPLNSLRWSGDPASLARTEDALRHKLLSLDEPLWAVQAESGAALTGGGAIHAQDGLPVLGYAPACPIQSLGDEAFRRTYGLRANYYAGAMANAIASEEMVIALGKAGLLGSFGAAGLLPQRLEETIRRVQAALPAGPYAFNLINSPFEPAIEQRAAELYLQYGVRVVEASAYLDVTTPLVHYRAAGLEPAADGSVTIRNRIIAKLSRKEVAKRFLSPAPKDVLQKLVEAGKITPLQAELAQRVPMADDLTVEADSGGHTDNRPLVVALPAILAYRDELQAKFGYHTPVRVGAAGGIGTPYAAHAAFAMGAAYIATGSINQACVESGASAHTKKLLSQVASTDVAMAPAADMFEMGVKVQVVRRGTMFAMRAQKLYEIYSRYESVEEIPPAEREKLEGQFFRRSMEEIWQECLRFFGERDPKQIERAERDPHQKMALIFRWYLGLSSRWSNTGEPGREMDYQIWCGPAMGAFNEWTAGTYLAQPENRRVVDVGIQILRGAAYLQRLRALQGCGVPLPAALEQVAPEETRQES